MLATRNVASLCGALIFAALLVVGSVTPGVAQLAAESGLLLKVDKNAYLYDRDQLRAMASAEHQTFRGHKRNPAVPLEVLLTKDTQVPLDRVRRVVIIGETKTLALEGERLKLIPTLW